MSQAEELLNNVSENDIATYTAEPEIEGHIIVGKDRFIEVPEPLRRIAVQYDHNIETVTFDCPRYWDDHDLMDMYIFINYSRTDEVKGKCVVKNIRVDELDSNLIHFEWDIGQEISLVPGPLTFLVCAVQFNSNKEEIYHWNSERNEQMTVSLGLEVDGDIQERYDSIIAELLAKMDAITNDLPIDDDLVQSGFAADAAVVGERLTEINTNIETINANILDLDGRVTQNSTDIVTINDNIAAIEERLTENDTNNETINNYMSDLDSRISQNSTSIETINTNVETINTNIATINDQITQANTDIETLKNNSTSIIGGLFIPKLTTTYNSSISITSDFNKQIGSFFRMGNLVFYNIDIELQGPIRYDGELSYQPVVISGLIRTPSTKYDRRSPATIGYINGIKTDPAKSCGFVAYLDNETGYIHILQSIQAIDRQSIMPIYYNDFIIESDSASDDDMCSDCFIINVSGFYYTEDTDSDHSDNNSRPSMGDSSDSDNDSSGSSSSGSGSSSSSNEDYSADRTP